MYVCMYVCKMYDCVCVYVRVYYMLCMCFYITIILHVYNNNNSVMFVATLV